MTNIDVAIIEFQLIAEIGLTPTQRDILEDIMQELLDKKDLCRPKGSNTYVANIDTWKK